jgi:hypothetical protein
MVSNPSADPDLEPGSLNHMRLHTGPDPKHYTYKMPPAKNETFLQCTNYRIYTVYMTCIAY